MKVQFLIVFILYMMPFWTSGSYAANYYVSSETGNDERTLAQARNPETPWKSIEKVNTQFNNLKPGDAILFRRGETFYGTLQITASGSATSPIIIGGYDSGSKPIITSFQSINGWKSMGNGLYESIESVNTENVQVLLINGKRYEMGRYPNVATDNEGYLTINEVGKNKIYSEQLNSSPNWRGAEIVIKTKDWVINKYKIESHNSQQIQYNGNISPYKAQVDYGFFISNHISTLDSFGEWYFNPNTKKIYVYLGEANPSSMNIEVSTLNNLLTKDYKASNIIIESIQFKGANENIIHLEGGNNVIIRNSEIEFSGEDGIISMGVSDLVITNNIVRNTYNNSLNLRYGNNGAIVQENKISNTGLISGRTRNDDAAGIGIFVSGEGILVQNNSIINTGFNGIQFRGNHTIIKNNYVDTYCLIKSDGGGIYTFGGTEHQTYENRRIEGNIVVNGIGSLGGVPKRGVDFKLLAEGIFLDDYSNNITVIGNTIGNTTNSGLKISNGNSIYVLNNSFYNNQYAITLGNSTIGQDTRDINISNNQFFTKQADQFSYGIKTHKDDISLMADFDKNYFFRPLGDEFSILNQYLKNGEIEKTTVDLNHWRERYGKDKNSTSNTIAISPYTIHKKIGTSLFPNSSFDENIEGISCNNCETDWEPFSKVSGGALKVSSSGLSSVKINLGALRKNKKYELSVKGYGSKISHLEFNLRFSDSPWERLSPVSTFEINKDLNDYKVLISPYQDENEVSLMIYSSEENINYWLDDLEFVEAEASVINPDEVMLFEINPTNNNKTISLVGTYVNARLEQFSGDVTLPPYGSLALFRVDETNMLNEKEKGMYYHIGNQGTIKYNELTFEKINSEYLVSVGSNFSKNENGSIEELFQAAIIDEVIAYKIPIDNGVYTVKTYHNELFFGEKGIPEQAGQRVFDIAIEDKIVKKDLDLFLENNNKETILSFTNIRISDGFLDLYLKASVNNCLISGIAIIPAKFEVTEETDFNTSSHEAIAFQDKEFVSSSNFITSPNSTAYTNITASDEELFQYERFASSLEFQIPVENGSYTIKTYHNELYFGKGGAIARAGNRVFDILLEGDLVKDDFDLFLHSNNEPTTLTFDSILVKDGVLNLQLVASVNNATISGLSIIPHRKDSIPVTDYTYFLNTGGRTDEELTGITFLAEEKSENYFNRESGRFEINERETKALFQTERNGEKLIYKIPVPNGKYTVFTMHNELWFGKIEGASKAGKRVFDIALQGEILKNDVDLFVENKNHPVIFSFENIFATDGELILEMTSKVNIASISGIAIIGNETKYLNIVPRLKALQEDYYNKKFLTDGKIRTYPNPAKGAVTLEINAEFEKGSVHIYNSNGQLVSHHNWIKSTGNTLNIPLDNILKGLYFINISHGQTVVYKQKLIVNP